VAVGPTGSPTVVATVRGRGPTQLWGHGRQPIPVPIDAIPSGQPVLGRMRKSGTSTAAWTWAIQFYKKPIAGNLETTTRQLRSLPSAAAAIALNTSASGYVFGTWTQLTSGAPVDMALAAIICSQPVATQWFELEIGKGPSGSETVVTRVKGFNSDAWVNPGYIALDNPVTGILAGNRVVARWRKSGTNTTQMDVAIQYYEVPL
jgi:hypothetical protein